MGKLLKALHRVEKKKAEAAAPKVEESVQGPELEAQEETPQPVPSLPDNWREVVESWDGAAETFWLEVRNAAKNHGWTKEEAEARVFPKYRRWLTP